jgi:hypothetical protein
MPFILIWEVRMMYTSHVTQHRDQLNTLFQFSTDGSLGMETTLWASRKRKWQRQEETRVFSRARPGLGNNFLWIKLPVREANHSSPSTAIGQKDRKCVAVVFFSTSVERQRKLRNFSLSAPLHFLCCNLLHFNILLHYTDLTFGAHLPSMCNVIHCSLFVCLYWTLHVSA